MLVKITYEINDKHIVPGTLEQLYVTKGIESHYQDIIYPVEYISILDNIDRFQKRNPFANLVGGELLHAPWAVIGKVKDEAWRFQDEIRYCLYFKIKNYQLSSIAEYDRYQPDIESVPFIDVSMSVDRLNEGEIILGPCMKMEDREKVLHIFENNVVSMKISDSIWTDKVKCNDNF